MMFAGGGGAAGISGSRMADRLNAIAGYIESEINILADSVSYLHSRILIHSGLSQTASNDAVQLFLGKRHYLPPMPKSCFVYTRCSATLAAASARVMPYRSIRALMSSISVAR